MLTPETAWSGLRPDELARELRSSGADWWVCGGWAIDLFLGGETREHADLDIGCFRIDLPRFRNLPNWISLGAHDGALHQLDADKALPAHIHSLWFAREGATEWGFQLMVERNRGESWLFRRNVAIKRHMLELWWTADSGLRVIKPEIQLLYKAHEPRPHDEMDFQSVLPRLKPADRDWLRRSLETMYPGHAWTTLIESEHAT